MGLRSQQCIRDYKKKKKKKKRTRNVNAHLLNSYNVVYFHSSTTDVTELSENKTLLFFLRFRMHLLHCYWDESSRPSTISISLSPCIGHVPPYAILSHRWAANSDEEVTFEDMMSPHSAKIKRGYEKIRGCCAQALRDGYNWVWIDTCCIDKRSSAELSEAINSMYSWYEKSKTCYAYLEDVCSLDGPRPLRASSWFKRGWTLQELIAPTEVEFFSRDWNRIGTKSESAHLLADISGVAQDALKSGLHVYKASIAEKMSWASGRETTKEEDRAYSLMGIFGVNMPTLYGEGSRAFTRLQHEILRLSNDHSIFAWQRKRLVAGLLAESPDEFVYHSPLFPLNYGAFVDTFRISNPKPDFAMTNFGLHIQLPLAPISGFEGYFLALLACTTSFDARENLDSWPAISLRRVPRGFPRQFMRTSFRNQMIHYCRLPNNYDFDTEPIWVSSGDDVSPLFWKYPDEGPSPPLLLPVSESSKEDTVTIIMERRQRYITIDSAYPPEQFSHGNEVQLRVSRTAVGSLGVMVAQNERGRGRIVIVFFILSRYLCVGLSQTVGDEDADSIFKTILSKGVILTGFMAIPFNDSEENFTFVGGYFVSMECVNAGALIYRFTVGPGFRDRRRGSATCAGRAIQLNLTFPVFPGAFSEATITDFFQANARMWEYVQGLQSQEELEALDSVPRGLSTLLGDFRDVWSQFFSSLSSRWFEDGVQWNFGLECSLALDSID